MRLEEERKVTILDEYDCVDMSDRLRILIDSPRDPSLADIMSEIYKTDGHIYFDGSYYYHGGKYELDCSEYGWFLDLFVINDS